MALEGNGFRLEWILEGKKIICILYNIYKSYCISGCGGVLTAPKGSIQSPNYPNHYPPLIQCEWKIAVDFGSSIKITFHEVEIEKDYDCQYDFVEIFNGEDATYPEIARFCHQNTPITVTGGGNFMFIRFQTDNSFQGKGFYANYTSEPTSK